MKNRTDLNLGDVVYISSIYDIPDSWLNWFNLTIFVSDGVAVQTTNTMNSYFVERGRIALGGSMGPGIKFPKRRK